MGGLIDFYQTTIGWNGLYKMNMVHGVALSNDSFKTVFQFSIDITGIIFSNWYLI